MQLTTKQEQALKLAVANYNFGLPYTVIAGYAGSGKSTLVKYIISALNLNPEEDVCYVAYTGKAAQVLKQKGCPNAMTAHKLLYHAQQTKSGNYIFKPKSYLEESPKLIVVDEVSMIPQEIWDLLMRHRVHVLALGDPEQLPPVKEDCNEILEHPHIFLDEIMRQAQESAIIRLSMHIREGKDFRTFESVPGEVRIVPKRFLFNDEDMAVLQASQIICGTNNQRFELNDRVRKLQGRGVIPEPGDKIVGLKNHWDFCSQQGNALTNGSLGELLEYEHFIQTYPEDKAFKDFPPTDIIYTNMRTEDGDEFLRIPIDYKALTTGVRTLTYAQDYELGQYNKKIQKKIIRTGNFKWAEDFRDIPYEFNYGYAITCWKSQGSQYKNVLGYDCSWLKKKDPDQYRKYLYTLVTRAEEKLILVGD